MKSSHNTLKNIFLNDHILQPSIFLNFPHITITHFYTLSYIIITPFSLNYRTLHPIPLQLFYINYTLFSRSHHKRSFLPISCITFTIYFPNILNIIASFPKTSYITIVQIINQHYHPFSLNYRTFPPKQSFNINIYSSNPLHIIHTYFPQNKSTSFTTYFP